jgi:hypothetical protein
MWPAVIESFPTPDVTIQLYSTVHVASLLPFPLSSKAIIRCKDSRAPSDEIGDHWSDGIYQGIDGDNIKMNLKYGESVCIETIWPW